MTQFRCTIHNITFEASDIDKKLFPHLDDAYVQCPFCSWDDRKRLRESVDILTKHRDTLLRAFEIKRTVEKVGK